jgi:two-component system, OmpR family, clock-associated histidine kinase SasA
MQSYFEPSAQPDAPLQFLLFVDQRPSSQEQVRLIRSQLDRLGEAGSFELQIIDIVDQPYLAEHFRLITTPALIKIYPEPRQTLTGTNLIAQLTSWWPRWQQMAGEGLLQSEAQADAQAGAQAANLARVSPLNSPSNSPSNSRASSLSNNPSSSLPNSQMSARQSIVQATELLRMTDEIFRLNQQNEELRAQLAFKNQIISMLAHDLRNPLTAASIAIETLDRGYHPKEDQPSRLTPALITQLLKHARTQIRTIDRMITDILQAARGSTAELRIQPQPMEIGQLCRRVLDTYPTRFAAQDLQVETDIPFDLPQVYADSERLTQVLVNLLDNAIKYTPRSGRLHISILHRTTQKIQVSICDNGPGIPEENRDRIFEDHFRLQRDEGAEGYGIGLSLCQRIVRAHYGQIWVDSVPDQGSCFHFTLPVFRGMGGLG